jgi:hypothetical protein
LLTIQAQALIADYSAHCVGTRPALVVVRIWQVGMLYPDWETVPVMRKNDVSRLSVLDLIFIVSAVASLSVLCWFFVS